MNDSIAITAILFIGGIIAGWITHVIWVIKILMVGAPTSAQMALGIIGAIAPPVGVIHGIYLWLA